MFFWLVDVPVVFLIAAVVVVGGSGEVTVQPRRLVAVAGHDAVLGCRTSRPEGSRLSWRRRVAGRALYSNVISADGRRQRTAETVDDHGRPARLDVVIESVQPSDAGDYQVLTVGYSRENFTIQCWDKREKILRFYLPLVSLLTQNGKQKTKMHLFSIMSGLKTKNTSCCCHLAHESIHNVKIYRFTIIYHSIHHV